MVDRRISGLQIKEIGTSVIAIVLSIANHATTGQVKLVTPCK